MQVERDVRCPLNFIFTSSGNPGQAVSPQCQLQVLRCPVSAKSTGIVSCYVEFALFYNGLRRHGIIYYFGSSPLWSFQLDQ
jgi:hypothetical protein